MAACKTLQSYGELDVARADDVLDLEVGELGVEPELQSEMLAYDDETEQERLQ